ncbi:hypothetical protein DDZ13_09775 [Coraliomargarita sinensis]|uniref:Uncharacterized protein n=1 Tax=Coraliomargarita sinensis TaxID=2174842 RepID=A0A317ZJ39_9BACT|nr:hypothetical protein [Coraliomargarita sinensis]PXA03918.1 hypothetical protein DDZ13_09775 [Coraliomargarita sinensis]
MVIPFVGLSANETPEQPQLSDLSVEKFAEKHDGKYTDLFISFKNQPDFRRLCRKHRLDDPAVWDTLRQRFVLNLAELQGRLSDAESMMATPDKKGGLNKKVISAEKTRTRGKELKDALVTQMDEMRQMIRLIDEFKLALNEMGPDQALTGEIDIENQAGQGFAGQVLFIDGNDLLVKRGEGAYFRVPSKLLSENTRLAILNELVSDWEALPEMDQESEVEDRNAGALIAYDDSHLYIDDRFEGFVSQARAESEFTFVPYKKQVELLKEEAAENSRNRDYYEQKMETLKNGYSTNQSRVEAIEWHESRLGVAFPESDREEAKAYREEKYGADEAEEVEEVEEAVDPNTESETPEAEEATLEPDTNLLPAE